MIKKQITKNNKESIFIFGASGHAKVIVDIVEQENYYIINGIFDDDSLLWGKNIFGYPVLGGRELINNKKLKLLIAVGNNAIRCNLAGIFKQNGCSFIKTLHPNAAISRGVEIGNGTVVMAGVVINADTKIDNHVIINSGATVDHDCIISEAAHIAPGAHLCGGVFVGKRTLVGVGVTVIPNIKIGNDAIIGAGACVTKSVPSGETVVGIPAKSIT
ncbi:Serine acetyltransferase-like protein [Candidatus Magnetomoraceae bacterium gMMP-1]